MQELELPILVFGGGYGNLEALQALMVWAKDRALSPRQILNTGDAVAYCANPVETIEALHAWGIQSIAGNVEIQLAHDGDDCGCGFREGTVCDTLSRRWYPFLKSQLRAPHLEWMRALPTRLEVSVKGYRVAVVHGSPENVSEYVFQSTPWNRKLELFRHVDADIILAGHSGLPFVQAQNGKVWLNSGALGLPANDGTPRTWAALIQEQDGELIFETVPIEYDFAKAQQKMNKILALKSYAPALKSGLWPSCEILRPEESQERGKAIRPQVAALAVAGLKNAIAT